MAENNEKTSGACRGGINPVIAVGFVVFASFLIRLVHLAGRSFYVDEVVTIYVSSRPFSAILPFMMQIGEVHPPLYFWMVNLWLGLWPMVKGVIPSFEAFTRLSSVIFATGGIYLTYLLGARLYDRLTGLTAALMLAFSTYHVFYSQELRMYPMLLFLFLASFNLFLVFLEKPSVSAGAGLVLVNSAALLTHYYGVYIFLVELTFGIYLLIKLKNANNGENQTEVSGKKPDDCKDKDTPRAGKIRDSGNVPFFSGRLLSGRPDSFIPWFLSGRAPAKKNVTATVLVSIASALVLVWWVPFFLRQTGHQDFTLRVNPGLMALPELFSRMAYGSTLPGALEGGPGLYHLAGLLPIFLIIRGLWRDRNHGGFFAGAYLLVPLLVTLVITFTRFHIFEYKYFFILAPVFWILLVRGTGGIRLGKYSGGLLIAVFIIVNVFSASNFFFNPYFQTQNWRGAARAVAKAAKPGEGVIVTPSMMSLPFYYYYKDKSRVMPMDRPDPVRLKPLFSRGASIWLVSTVNHPYVKQTGLIPFLASRMDGGAVVKIRNHNPADVLVVYYFRPLQKEKVKNRRNSNIPLK